MTKKIVFIVPPKVHLLDLNGPIHAFYEANEYGASFDLQFASIFEENNSVTSSAGLALTNMVSFEEITLSETDYVFIPGISFSTLSDISFLSKCKGFFEWLRIQNSKNVKICSVCTGLFLLAEADILNGKKCTTHWNRIEDFNERYPNIKVERNKMFVANENIYSSAGVTAGIDLSLHIIDKELGAKFAVDVAKEMVVYFRRGESDDQVNPYLQYRNHMENRIHDAQTYILKNLEKSIVQEDIAEAVGMSGRNLSRLFKKTTGVSIGFYREKLRVERASQMLKESNKMQTIANACGLNSTNQLRTLLKKHNKFS
ncbi:GlxA family transcriptional regulator [Croceitalea rosinachiae]|uniref:DJ-1/PfpI family protein n=1 Tax=Croceitalea rosinachiae TaxID=3075596 RepID=A0ABU3AD74_9FLAO|nr:DJ-1/PfpI family protein [Croceitalea sp. F388]MDT0608136.1 DJ-1/PfpI family protein [Croceitalea sp. F388]